MKLTCEGKLNIALSALATIRQNRRKPGDWEASIIDKAFKMINEPEKFDWSHLGIEKTHEPR